jgi:hypothetical protein
MVAGIVWLPIVGIVWPSVPDWLLNLICLVSMDLEVVDQDAEAKLSVRIG